MQEWSEETSETSLFRAFEVIYSDALNIALAANLQSLIGHLLDCVCICLEWFGWLGSALCTAEDANGQNCDD
jgi:hypothetical protein